MSLICICGAVPDHPSGLCRSCGRKRAAIEAQRRADEADGLVPRPLPMPRLNCKPTPRPPLPGWIKLAPGRYTLDVGLLRLAVYPPRPDREVRGWAVEIDDVEITHGFVPTDAGEGAAQLAAEDALFALGDQIAAVRRG